MAKSSEEYWADRERENLEKNLKTEAEYFKEIEDIYRYTMAQIQKEIDSFYAKYASKEGISIAEAKKRVSKLDMEEFSRKAKKYVEEKNFSKQANDEMRLYNLTMKVNRLELLKAQIGLELVAGFDELQQFFDEKLTERTMEEFQRQAGILGYTILDNAKMAEAIVNASFKNATFSERIWTHQDLLRAELEKLLKTGLIQGRNPRELARQLRKVFDTSIFNSERLLRTELARVQTEAQKQSYIRNGFDQYTYITCGDGKVCSECKPRNGKHYDVENMMPGENAPPMHPLCRCSTAAYIDDKSYEDWLSGYKDHGLSFNDWKSRRNQNKRPEMKLADAKLKRYTKNEIRDIAKEADKIAGKHVSRRSKWSGRVVVDDEATFYGKLWSCDIATATETSGHILLHEQLHARSISHFDPETYVKYQKIEEATVQLLAQEISKAEGIEINKSMYDDLANNLRTINQKIHIAESDYNFALQIFEQSVPERLGWIEDKIAEAMKDGGTIELYREMNRLVELLYGGM